MNFLSFRILIRRIKSIKYLMRDKNVSKWKKGLIVLAIAYLCMPIDLIPIVIPVFGIMDDILLWIFVLWTLKDQLDAYWVDDQTVDRKRKYRNKNIIEDVEYRVENENDASSNKDKAEED